MSSLDDALDLAASHDLHLSSNGAAVIEAGLDHRVIMATDGTGHGWVLRIPRREDASEGMAAEVRVLVDRDGAITDGLDRTCRETMTHILDDLGFYAVLLSGTHRVEGYTPLMEFTPVPGRMEGTLWPENDAGTEVMLNCLDAVGGLLVAVVASAPLDRIFPHATRTEDPWGNLLTATGRTSATRGLPWKWISVSRTESNHGE